MSILYRLLKNRIKKTCLARAVTSKVLSSLLCFSLLAGLSSSCQQKAEKHTCFSPILEVPFDDSMGKSESEFRFIFANADDAARYTKFKALYEKNLPSKIQAGTSSGTGSNPKIPKIIHQIWLGPNLPPSYFHDFQARWKSLHPDWEYHLWSEADLEALNLDNWDLVEKSQNWAEKADVIRCDLLDKFGGVYLDVDMEPCHSMNELHEKYDFYAGLEHPHKIATTNNRVWVGISIMASRPGHPIMKNWKKRIRAGWDEVDLRFSSPIERVINHTYFPFTHAVCQEIDQNGNVDILFPATYLYPIAPSYASKRRSALRAIREKLYDVLENLHLKRPRAFSRIYPETIAVHYWGNSWLPDQETQLRDTQRLVDSARKDLYKVQHRLRVLERQAVAYEERLMNLLQRFESTQEGKDTGEPVANSQQL